MVQEEDVKNEELTKLENNDVERELFVTIFYN